MFQLVDQQAVDEREYTAGLSPQQLKALDRRGAKGKKSRLLEMQRILFATVCTDPEPTHKAACARTYELLDERLRIVDGRLKPGSINARDDSRAQPAKRPKKTGKLRDALRAEAGQTNQVIASSESAQRNLLSGQSVPNQAGPEGGEAAGGSSG